MPRPALDLAPGPARLRRFQRCHPRPTWRGPATGLPRAPVSCWPPAMPCRGPRKMSCPSPFLQGEANRAHSPQWHPGARLPVPVLLGVADQL